jgi:hypothetical protein
LDGVVDGKVRVVSGGRVDEVPISTIEKARIVFEFGLSGRTDKSKH